MATFICGAFVAAGLYHALRHVYRNFQLGREDCCGGSCDYCSGTCGACHPVLDKSKA